MTYQHALAYLAEQATNSPLLPIEQLPPIESGAAPLVVCFSHDKQGHAAAVLLRAALTAQGVGSLHVIDAPEYEPRERYLLDGKAMLPTVLCPIAHELREREIKVRRALSADASSVFSPSHRALHVLLRCMRQENARVLLLEGEAAAAHLRVLCELVSGVRAITVVSATDQGGRCALESIQPATREVISHPSGSTLFRALSDACVRTGSRLGIIARTAHGRDAVTPGAQSVHYATLKDCRLRAGSALVAEASVLAAEAAFALRRAGLAISDDAIRQGLGQVPPLGCTTPVAIHPPVLAELATNELELALTMRDLGELAGHLPRPRRVVLEGALLPFFTAYRDFADVVCEMPEDEQIDFGSTVYIGSVAFLKRMTREGGKK